MANLYLSRMMFKDSAGIFQFPDGDIKSSEISISGAVNRVQGQSIETTETTGFVIANYSIDLTFSIMQRKASVYLDLIKRINNSNNLSIAALIAQTGGTTGLQIGTFITLTGCVCSSQNLRAPDQGTELTIDYSLMAQNYIEGNGLSG